MNVFTVGVGLIGGSFIKDLRAVQPLAKFYGIDRNSEHLQQAVDLGLIDAVATFEDLPLADLVILAIPVDAIITQLPKILDVISVNCLVLDSGSTKEQICGVVSAHRKRKHFLACHPIAGTEFSGPKAALHGLYREKTNIICESDKTDPKFLERGLEIFKSLGMRIRFMDPKNHDKHIAYVSHLSHISSFMLGKTVIEKEQNERNIFDMAGSGFESTVRLAKSSPDMWTPIFKQNKKYVLDTLNEYIQNLSDFKEMLDADDYQGIYNVMNNTNRIKEILKGIPANKK
jgi:prephenate dehydrogenase